MAQREPLPVLMQLNNFLQSQGGTSRLDWHEWMNGPIHQPRWHFVCYIDGIVRGHGSGVSKSEAKESAAHRALTELLAENA